MVPVLSDMATATVAAAELALNTVKAQQYRFKPNCDSTTIRLYDTITTKN